jgi:hypothetical protein
MNGMKFDPNEYTIEVRGYRTENGAQVEYEQFTVLGQNDDHIPKKHLGIKPLFAHPDFKGMTVVFGSIEYRWFRF